MTINFGGNSFHTSLRDARAEIAQNDDADIYNAVIVDDLETSRPVYLTLVLGEGCSDASYDAVQACIAAGILASKSEGRWQ